jgi:hypothetical protein
MPASHASADVHPVKIEIRDGVTGFLRAFFERSREGDGVAVLPRAAVEYYDLFCHESVSPLVFLTAS